MASESDASRTERLRQLPLIGKGTEMGAFMRGFWHPIARSHRVEKGKSYGVTFFDEEFTLYRGESGQVYLTAGRCPHRGTLLHTGWVEGDNLRCLYHGWKYDTDGKCLERPAEPEDQPPEDVCIKTYPARDYSGLVFAYMGDGQAPEFDLPRKDALEEDGRIVHVTEEDWPCNWLQSVENSLDPAHVSFVHQKGRVGTFGATVTTDMPKLECYETDAGIRLVAIRGPNNIRATDWTFPNNNHILQPTLGPEDPWMNLLLWQVPVSDTVTKRLMIYSRPRINAEEDEKFLAYCQKSAEKYSSMALHRDLFEEQKFPDDTFMQLLSAQDYLAQVGQGAIADRTKEYLATSDAGVVFLRRILWRELSAFRAGQPTKQWKRLDEAADLPMQGPMAAQP